MKYLGVLLLVLSGNVMAEEVYYCSDIDANGFAKQGGPYESVNFRLHTDDYINRNNGGMLHQQLINDND